MKTSFYFLIAATVVYPFLNCSKGTAVTKTAGIGMAFVAQRTMLALGDSYTIGQSVDENLRFPAQAVALLDSEGMAIKMPDYVAKSGWTTIDLMSALQNARLDAKYDFVTLLIGVNDQYQGINISEYDNHFTQLLDKSIAYAAGQRDHVMVISIPDYSITPFVEPAGKALVSTQIEMYNKINEKITVQRGCKYIDITNIYLQGANDPSTMAGDHLHPSGKEYKKWAALIAEYIRTVK